jgi:hypothetical protein
MYCDLHRSAHARGFEPRNGAKMLAFQFYFLLILLLLICSYNKNLTMITLIMDQKIFP